MASGTTEYELYARLSGSSAVASFAHPGLRYVLKLTLGLRLGLRHFALRGCGLLPPERAHRVGDAKKLRRSKRMQPTA